MRKPLTEALDHATKLPLRLSRLPKSVLHTLTRDRGSENLNWKHIEKELGLKGILCSRLQFLRAWHK